jgi:NADH-quinone oxidoreductase subunit M
MRVLSLLVALPLVGAAAVAFLPTRRRELFLPVTLGVSMLPLGVAAWMLFEFATGEPGFQFVEDVTVSDQLGVGWRLGVDGISVFLVALTALLMPIAIVASRSITERVKTYMVSMLVLEAGLLGVFVALDLLVFFAFFEIVLVPMYLLIGIWGSENRAYASIKFVLYTALGSAFLLAGIIAMAVLTGDVVGSSTSFDFRQMLQVELSQTAELWLFLAFGIAFAIKVPMFPLHTWLPDAHTEAPTAGSVILAGVLLKMGTYGFIRFNLTLFPQASVDLAWVMAVLGVIGIVYGAAVAAVQPDVKRLVAYSSVSHLGFIVLGTFAFTSQGLQGSVIQMVSHGLTTGALFLLIGMIYDRRHTRKIADYGGLARVMPVFAGFFLFMAFASIGLPGLSGFIGEFTILLGSYLTWPALAIIGAGGVVLAAVYLLWAYERMFTGPIDKPENEGLADLRLREVAILVPLAVLVLVLGVNPRPVLDRIEPSVEVILDRIEAQTDFVVPDHGRVDDVVQVAPDGQDR